MTALSGLIEVPVYSQIKQQGIYILCVMKVPESARERIPQEIIKECHGEFLLRFSYKPSVGELFPYKQQIWQCTAQQIQFPARYKTSQKKHPAIIFCDWIRSYETVEEAVRLILGYINS
jgi:hypothetical protein